MRIFFAAADSPNAWALPASQIWKANLYAPLVDLGHDVVRFDYNYQPHNGHLDPTDPTQMRVIDRLRPLLGCELLRQLRKAHAQKPIDVLFTYFYSAYIEPEVIREIRRMGICTLNWYCNGSFQFHLVSDIAPAYDYCLVPEKFRLPDYRAAGATPIYCQEAANPNVYKPAAVPHEFDVTFVGQRYGNRPDFVKRLIAGGIDVRVWGPRWTEPMGKKFDPTAATDVMQGKRGAVAQATAAMPAAIADPDQELLRRAGDALSDDDLVTMYSRSRISLGFSAVAQRPKPGEDPIRQVRLRDFEAPMSGAFYLTEHLDELCEFFEPDREIVTFRTAEELTDKAAYYLKHPTEREKIREAGRRRALAEHTWHERFRMVFRTIGLPETGTDGLRRVG
ncbi:CgeB family protein [Humisphaera borealis]|uniref:Glycosyltransferase n=1 Tax=Humisphaera borealis TaxID=2807512 RepID=A0A7M2WV54_9BACT|nr:glycosyltransferase [Humisphaera borealis]QOV89437.1 glycosyltransferase [Humisphaera borealis]